MEKNQESDIVLEVKTDKEDGYIRYKALSALLCSVSLFLLISLFSDTKHDYFGISVVLLMFLGSIYLAYANYKGKMNDKTTFFSDGDIIFLQTPSKITVNAKNLVKIQFSDYHTKHFIVFSDKKDYLGSPSDIFDLEFAYYSLGSIKIIFQKLKELNPNIEFDEESKKILDGEFK